MGHNLKIPSHISEWLIGLLIDIQAAGLSSKVGVYGDPFEQLQQ